MFKYDTKILMIKLYSGSYVKKYNKDYAHEKLNLDENSGKFYGIVNGWSNKKNTVNNLDISRIDSVAKKKEFNDDVLVIYVEEANNSNVKIVAFAKNSRIYRQAQSGSNLNRIIEDPISKSRNIVDYHIVTEGSDMYKNLGTTFIVDFKKYPALRQMFRDQKSYLDTPTDKNKTQIYQELKSEIIDYLNAYINNNEYELLNEEIEEAQIDDNTTSYLNKMKIKITNQGPILEKNAAVSKKAIESNGYKCTYDNTHKTFLTKKGNQYMEGHHLIRCTESIATQIWNKYGRSVDTENNIVSLCPNCHRMIHYGNKEQKEEIIKNLYEKQINKLKSIGINISIEELYKIYDC